MRRAATFPGLMDGTMCGKRERLFRASEFSKWLGTDDWISLDKEIKALAGTVEFAAGMTPGFVATHYRDMDEIYDRIAIAP